MKKGSSAGKFLHRQKHDFAQSNTQSLSKVLKRLASLSDNDRAKALKLSQVRMFLGLR